MKWGRRKKPDPAYNMMRTNQALSGGRALESLSKGNIAGAAYYARKSSIYGKAAKERKGENNPKTQPQTIKSKKGLTPSQKYTLQVAAGLGITAAYYKYSKDPKVRSRVNGVLSKLGNRKMSTINPMDEFRKYQGDLGYFA